MMIWIAGVTSVVSFTPHQLVNADGKENETVAHARIAMPND